MKGKVVQQSCMHSCHCLYACRYEVIKNVYVPSSEFKFPAHDDYGKQRRFSHAWLQDHSPWLTYSKVLDGGFCLPCVLFARPQANVDVGVLVTKPLTTFNKATEILRKHSTQVKYHKNAMIDMNNFMHRMEQRQLSVYDLAHTTHARLIEKNRLKLKSILKCIVWCGRQNIALRGHRDDDKHINQDYKGNPGNFKALLQFRVESGDHVLKEHFETAPKNAVYSSKTIQNELIGVTGEWLTRKIVDQVKEARFFTVLADEVSDVSNTEQMSIVVRYVDGLLDIREEFLEFVSCKSGTTGEALSENILSTLQKHGLDVGLLRGQGYDGAGAMAGCVSGVAARIQSQFPLALYTHCFSHKLNLVIVDACKVQSVRNAMGVISKVALFFENSPKRQAALEEKIKETEQPNKKKHLLDLCRTRWIHRHEAFENFGQLYEVVVDLLEDVKSSHGWNQDTVTDASTLLSAITKFDFLMGFVVAWKCLTLVKPLSVSLQLSSIDICKAYKYVSKTKKSVQHVRDNVDDFNSNWFDIAKGKSEAVGADGPALPRRCGRQRDRNNVPAEEPAEYYKRSITIPFLDHLLTQFDQRFSSDQQRVVLGLSLVPAVMKEDTKWKENVMDLAAFYQSDLPSSDNLDMELVCWQTKWDDHDGDLPTRPKETLVWCDPTYFPNIHTLLRIICTLPVTSCSCERSISGLKRLKTYLRSTMGQERLNGLAMMHFHYEIDIDHDAVLDMFARRHPRRMTLLNVLDSDH